jgi:uncharacterized protein
MILILKKRRKRIVTFLSIVIILINVIAIFHAYHFTHFANANSVKTKAPERIDGVDKVKTLLFGVSNPRPTNKVFPRQAFETIVLQSNKTIEIWKIKTDSAKGTVVLCHGFSGQKSSMLDKSDEFLKMGYNTILVDFMGSGGSEGNQTTIGFKEAEQVKTVYDYLQKQGEQNIYLFGTSMGAVAIMKAIDSYKIEPKAIILECPFGTMYETVCARFKNMNAPTFPMAGLLVFWGGTINGFWAFDHNPSEYAKSIHCPTLLLYGEKDKNVSRKEIDDIYRNLDGKKELISYPLAGHENYLIQYKSEWIKDVSAFLITNLSNG